MNSLKRDKKIDCCVTVGVISDTHFSTLAPAVAFAEMLLEGPFSQVEMILHAGDMVLPEFEACFGDLPFYSVQGNMDASRPDLPLKRIINAGAYRIGLMHGWGAPGAVPAKVLGEFLHTGVDLVVFGHSHKPYNQVVGDILLFNPGSATDHRGHADSCSVGILDLGQTIKARHIFLAED